MDQRFLIEALSRKPELFKAMVEFNRVQQTSVIDRSLLASLGSLGNALLQDPAIRRSCTATRSPEPLCWWDFSEESCRLLLMPVDDLRKLALTFSAAVYAEEMALVLDREQVFELRTLLGDDIFHYAIRRGRYQIGSLRSFLISRMPTDSLAQSIKLLAASVMLSLSDEWPAEVQTLWKQKLEKTGLLATEVQHGENAVSESLLPPLRADQRRILWFTLKKLLLREAAPQWAPCFD